MQADVTSVSPLSEQRARLIVRNIDIQWLTQEFIIKDNIQYQPIKYALVHDKAVDKK